MKETFYMDFQLPKKAFTCSAMDEVDMIIKNLRKFALMTPDI